MLSASESMKSIVADVKAMKRQEGKEAALSTNKPWITASKTKIKRDAPEHMLIEGDHPETFFSLTEQTLHGVATVLKARRVQMERGAPRNDEWAARRKAALKERNVSALEVAFLYGYANEKPVRELRIRHGLNEHTGAPLKDKERPIVAGYRKRARR